MPLLLIHQLKEPASQEICLFQLHPLAYFKFSKTLLQKLASTIHRFEIFNQGFSLQVKHALIQLWNWPFQSNLKHKFLIFLLSIITSDRFHRNFINKVIFQIWPVPCPLPFKCTKRTTLAYHKLLQDEGNCCHPFLRWLNLYMHIQALL